MKYLISLSCLIALLAGCSDQGQQDRTIQMLQAAKANGKMTVSVSEHPLQFGQSTSFFAGPDTVVTFDGSVDFRENSELAELIGKAIAKATAEAPKPAIPQESY